MATQSALQYCLTFTIHTPTAESTMQGDSQLVGSSQSGAVRVRCLTQAHLNTQARRSWGLSQPALPPELLPPQMNASLLLTRASRPPHSKCLPSSPPPASLSSLLITPFPSPGSSLSSSCASSYQRRWLRSQTTSLENGVFPRWYAHAHRLTAHNEPVKQISL